MERPDNKDTELLRKIGSPLRIAKTLTPHLFGASAQFHPDPWLRMSEQKIMDAVEDREHQRFVKINAPAQCGKSTTVEQFAPTWILGHWPDTRIILIAYSDDIAIRSGSLVRDIFMKWGPEFYGLTVDPNYESKQEWRIAGHLGGMLSVGIGSRITGMPGDLVIIGDVIKGMEEAASQTTKDKHWKEFHGAIMPRLQPGGTMLLTATRFAEDDISGRLEQQMAMPDYDGDQWESLVFKAIAEPDFDDPNGDDPEWTDLLGRKVGEPLKTRFSYPGENHKDPETWHDSHFYKRKRAAEAGGESFTFSCIFQQTPTSPTGGMFPPEKWGWYDPRETPHMASLRRVWDLAASAGTGDWSVGVKVGKASDGAFYVLEVDRFQKGPDDVLDTAKNLVAVDGMAVPILVEASRNGDGKTVVAFYAKELAPATVKPANADGSKEDRARPYSTLMQKQRVLLPRYQDGVDDKGRPHYWMPDWVPKFIAEHRQMMGDGRKGRHDDQIDATAHAINDMIDSSMVQILNPDVALLSGSGMLGRGLIAAGPSRVV